jgi:hypothetical protein
VRRRLWLALLGALALAVSGTAEPALPPVGIGSFTVKEAEALARTVSTRVEEIRGLKFKRPVPVRMVSAQEARAHFAARLAKGWSEEKARHDQKAYQQLGLLPAGFDLASGLLDTLEDQAAGYYDPETGAFSLLREMPRSAAPLLMAHELTHALDDQHFDIDAHLGAAAEDDEAMGGIAAVVEGSGTLVMTVYVLEEMQAGRLSREGLTEFQAAEGARSASLKKVPEVLQRSLLAPYILGQTFLMRGQLENLRQGVNAADLKRAYDAPPASTEQVLHPEKYWSATPEAPRVVRVPELGPQLGASWSRVAEGSLGELTLGSLVGAGMPELNGAAGLLGKGWTNAAAAGWGGDRYVHYVSGTQGLTALATVWDTPKDAEEFAGALEGHPGRRAFRYGSSVVVVAGDLKERHEAVGTAILSKLAGLQSPPQ